MKTKKLFTIALSICLLLQLMVVPGYAAADFSDVKENAWYREYVDYVYDHNLMGGVSTAEFNPNGKLTRAMFVTILGRMAGVDLSNYNSTEFTDVVADSWYGGYVAWASSNGVVGGYGNNLFGTNDPVTREQMAAMIARYIESQELSLPETEEPVESFADAHKVSSWAKDGLELMRLTGLIKGDTAGNFNPKANSSRAEAATLFTRLHEALNSIEEPKPEPEPEPSPEPEPDSKPEPGPVQDMGGGDSIYVLSEEQIAFDEETQSYYVNDMLLVYPVKELSESEKSALADSVGGTVAAEITGAANILQIRVTKSSLAQLQAKAEQLMDNDSVGYACWDRPIQDELMSAEASGTGYEGDNWWYEAIEAEFVYDHYSYLMEPVTVGVIDGGVQSNHEDLRGKLSLISPYFTTFNNQLIQEARDGNTNSESSVTHGTHVSGIIGAKQNELGMTGIAPDSEIIFGSFKADPVESWNTELTAAYLLQEMVEREAKVINCSFGLCYFSQTAFDEKKAADPEGWDYDSYGDFLSFLTKEARDSARGMAALMCQMINNGNEFIVVQSAGNGVDNMGPGVTASANGNFCSIDEGSCWYIFDEFGVSYEDISKHIFVVGGIKNSKSGNNWDMETSFNYGDPMDICAPGVDIRSCVFENGYEAYGGTSMAAPMVSGTLACVWSINPEMTAAQVHDIVLNNYANMAQGKYLDKNYSYPVVNARLAVEAAIEDNGIVINNGGTAVRKGNYFYYWQPSGTTTETRYSLVRRDLWGTTATLYSGEKGSWPIYIAGDSIWFYRDGVDGDAFRLSESGSVVKSYTDTQIRACADGYLLLQAGDKAGSLSEGFHLYDIENQSMSYIAVLGKDHKYMGSADGAMYFSITTEDQKAVKIYKYLPGNTVLEGLGKATAAYDMGDPGHGYSECSTYHFQETTDAIFFSYGYIGGSGLFFQPGGGICRIEKESGKGELVADIGDSEFYVYEIDGIEYIRHYNDYGEEVCKNLDTGLIENITDPVCPLREPSISLKKTAVWNVFVTTNLSGKNHLVDEVKLGSYSGISFDNPEYLAGYAIYTVTSQREKPGVNPWWDSTEVAEINVYIHDFAKGETQLLASLK